MNGRAPAPAIEDNPTISIRCHEAEDATSVPLIYNDVGELNGSFDGRPANQLPNIFMALAVVRQQGRRRPRVVRYEDLKMLSIDGRLKSFSEDEEEVWQGPEPGTMARAGWYRLTSDRAACPFCSTKARQWAKGEDPWQRHKELSPWCRYLRQAGETGTALSPTGKRRLRHSISSLYDLLRPS